MIERICFFTLQKAGSVCSVRVADHDQILATSRLKIVPMLSFKIDGRLAFSITLSILQLTLERTGPICDLMSGPIKMDVLINVITSIRAYLHTSSQSEQFNE